MADCESVMFGSGAVGDYMPAGREGKSPAALIVHGWNSKPDSTTYLSLQELLHEAGYGALRLVLRGHAGAKGELEMVTREQHAQDITAAYHWLQRREDVNREQVIGVGASYGAYLLACLSQIGFSAFALRSPALYPDEGWDQPTASLVRSGTLWEWRSYPHTKDDVRAYREIAAFTGPLLLVWGDQDEDIPQSVFAAYGEAAVQAELVRKLILSETGHVFSGEAKQHFLKQVSCWAKNLHPSLK